MIPQWGNYWKMQYWFFHGEEKQKSKNKITNEKLIIRLLDKNKLINFQLGFQTNLPLKICECHFQSYYKAFQLQISISCK